MKILSRDLVIAAFAMIILSSWSSTAFAVCGDIITVYDYGDGQGAIDEREPIIDCTNPFNADTPAPFTYELTLAGQAVNDNAVISVSEAEPVTGSFVINKGGNFVAEPLQLFRREGDDYRQVASAWTENFEINPLVEGEYVVVLLYETLIFQVEAEPLWKRLINTVFLPSVAYASFPAGTEVVAIPFTVEYTVPEPLGASSVLFLPGIQASRLYTEGVLGTENQLWEPNRDADVEKLAMTAEGISLNDIYTKDVIDEVNILPAPQGNIYKGFLSMLDDMVEAKEIASSTAFAYDWRYSVFDVATKEVAYENETKRLLEEVLALAEGSYTGKVTLIAHSNGGLVAKALLYEYGEVELAGKIDKLVMIGTPQLGTPKAISSMLHGLDQSLGYGLIATANTVRQVTKNMPGAYTLLPSPEYFNKTNESVVTTDGSALAKAIADYGEINTAEKLQNFLLNSLDNRDEAIGLNEPITLNTQMSSDAINMQSILDDWRAPTGVAVYEVVGTGLATIKGFEYREYGCMESNSVCILDSYLKPFPIMTNEGDQTVVEISAEGYEGDKMTARVNLYDASFLKPKIHANLTESSQVQEFIDSVIKYPYLSDSVKVPNFTEVSTKYRIIGAHSPVSLLAVDQDGKQVGVIDDEVKEDISGSQYFELGGSKFLVLPSEANVDIKLVGVGGGVYSLSVDELDEAGKQKQISLLTNATTSLDMTARFSVKDGEYSSLQTDLDGDGIVDLEQTLNGEMISKPVSVYNYSDLDVAIRDLKLGKRQEKVLLLRLHWAEFFAEKSSQNKFFEKLENKTLSLILANLKQLNRRGIIKDQDLSLIEEMISNLK